MPLCLLWVAFAGVTPVGTKLRPYGTGQEGCPGSRETPRESCLCHYLPV